MAAVPRRSALSGISNARSPSSGSHRWRSFPPPPKSVRIWEVRPADPDEQTRESHTGVWARRCCSGRLWLVMAVLLGVAACIAVLNGWVQVPNYLGD